MSGGHFDYMDRRLYQWSSQVRMDGNPLLADLLHDLGDLLHEYDWWKSGDTGREKWLNAWDAWKKKWLNGNATDLTIDAVRDMVRQMLWECLGNPADAEYDRIEERMRSW